jgi:hypothetical protein
VTEVYLVRLTSLISVQLLLYLQIFDLYSKRLTSAALPLAKLNSGRRFTSTTGVQLVRCFATPLTLIQIPPNEWSVSLLATSLLTTLMLYNPKPTQNLTFDVPPAITLPRLTLHLFHPPTLFHPHIPGGSEASEIRTS